MKPLPFRSMNLASTALVVAALGVLAGGANPASAKDLEQVLEAHAARAACVSTARIEWSAIRTDAAGSYNPGLVGGDTTTDAPPRSIELRDGGLLLKRGAAWKLDRRQELWSVPENAVQVSRTSSSFDGAGEGRMLDRDRGAGYLANANPVLEDVVLHGYELALRPDALDPASPDNAFRSSNVVLERTEEIDGVPCAVLVAREGRSSTEIAVRPDGAPVRSVFTNDEPSLSIALDLRYATETAPIPDRIHVRGSFAGRAFTVAVTTESAVFDGAISDEDIALEFEDGTEVLDRRTNRKSIVGASGSRER